MKRLTFERVGIFLFCATLIGSGALTVTMNCKTIAKNVYLNVKNAYANDGAEGVVKGAISGVEAGVNEAVVGRTSYINLYGLSARLLNKKYIIDTDVSNSVIKDNTGKLEFITYPIDTTPYVENIKEIKAITDELGGKILYVQTPVKTMAGYVEMPTGLKDYANQNTDNLMKQLKEIGVETLDLRQNVFDDKLDLKNVFYDTDHHWKTETAFWAVGETVDTLKEKFDIDLDPDKFYTDSNNYQNIYYEKNFLGSQGRRVGKYYGGVDDYTLMLPTYETSYNVTINKVNASSNIEGDFKKAIVKDNLLNEENIFTNRYASYFGADYPEVIIKNEKAPNDMKVLIFKDSFGIPYSAFFSTLVSETRMLDTRYFTDDVKEYIKAYDPDLVLYVFKSLNTQK